MSALARLNALSLESATAELLRCCGSTRWARAVAEARPFATAEALRARADAAWAETSEADWREAFAAHPRIGSKRDVASAAPATRTWAEGEQAGTRGAAEQTLAALAEENRAYEARFGFIFLICATGKTADEMLAACRERQKNDPAAEVRVAAAEQHQITRIRLEKLLGGDS